jgi:hypothetical protein
LAWNPSNWDVTVHSRDVDTWERLPAVEAHHDEACSSPLAEKPLATHAVTSYEDAVFQCRDHVMTSINTPGYGLIELTPAAMVDFSGGVATVRVDVSTWRSSTRDWWDIWITPFDDNLQLPFTSTDPDLHGPPMNAINITMPGENVFLATLYREGQPPLELNGAGWQHTPYNQWLTPDPARRDTFELKISRTSLEFGMPNYPTAEKWVDATFDQLDWSQGVVQFGHHSYNPTKDCNVANNPGPDGTCQPNTWHWDNVQISPAAPFTMIKSDRRSVIGEQTAVNFAAPAPGNAHLRFAGVGERIDVSFDGGSTWTKAQTQRHLAPTNAGHFDSYWTPIPAGTTSVTFRGQGQSGAPWAARDISIWANNGQPTPVPASGGADGGPRLLDTRPGATTTDGFAAGVGLRSAGTVYELPVIGRAGVPAGATAVALNFTAVDAEGPGYVTAWPCGEPQPNASNINYLASAPVAGSTIVKVGAAGSVCVYIGQSSTHLLADVTGWFSAASGYVPRSGARLLDTRPGAATVDGAGQLGGLPAVGTVYEVQVTGRASVPGDVIAAALTITSADAAGAGYISAWPCGEPQPNASNVNFASGDTVANSALIKVGAGGKVCLLVAERPTHVIVDITGWFTGSEYQSRAGARILDTRTGGQSVDGIDIGTGAVAAGTTRELQVTGRAGVPANATAVVLNLTSTDQDGWGYVTAWACGTPRPNASSLNYDGSKAVTNLTLLKVGAGGKVCLFVAEQSSHLIADVNGWFVPGSPFQSVALTTGAEVGRSAPSTAAGFYCELPKAPALIA